MVVSDDEALILKPCLYMFYMCSKYNEFMLINISVVEPEVSAPVIPKVAIFSNFTPKFSIY